MARQLQGYGHAAPTHAHEAHGSEREGLEYNQTVARTDMGINDHGPREPYGYTAGPFDPRQARDGYPSPSETYRWGDHGTEWPMDAFTGMIVDDTAVPITTPAAHSYAPDGNMEAYRIAGQYSRDNLAATDLGEFTGATGPTGHMTPIDHPQLTAPRSPAYEDDRPHDVPAQSRL